MKYSHSLRNRILIAFCVFGFCLSLTYWFMIDISMVLVEDMVFKNQLKNEISFYLKQRKSDPAAPLPNFRYITSYIGLEKMPMPWKQIVRDLRAGFYETDGLGAIEGPDDHHLAVKKIPDHNELFYLFYDVGNLKVNVKYESIVGTILFFTSIVVAGIGGVIGVLLVRKVIAPLTELADHVAKSAPENLLIGLSKQFADDEIGFLARKLEQSMQRIDAFIQREKSFTRYASHELRTPVTVIKGAVELINQLPEYEKKSIQRPVKRIERSVKGMALTIDTFLWLAREDGKLSIDQTCDVISEVREAFIEHQYLFKEKSIKAELHENGDPVIKAPPVIFKIVINNLLHNAFSHTPKGKIHLIVKNTGIELFI